MGISEEQPRTFFRDDIRIEASGRQITLKHSHWLKRRKPDTFSLEDIQSLHALIEEPWILSLLFTHVNGELHLLDERMGGWKELLEKLPVLLNGFKESAIDEAQRHLRNPILCWERGAPPGETGNRQRAARV